jgi:hypothetical protein
MTKRKPPTTGERIWHIVGQVYLVVGIIASIVVVLPLKTDSREPQQYAGPPAMQWTIPSPHLESRLVERPPQVCR